MRENAEKYSIVGLKVSRSTSALGKLYVETMSGIDVH